MKSIQHGTGVRPYQQQTGLYRPIQGFNPQPRRPLGWIVRATKDESRQSTLDALDNLLGQDAERSKAEDVQPLAWWQLKPRQAAPPRTTGVSGGRHGRLLVSEGLLKMNELRVGRQTTLGEQLELPKVQPILSFVLLLINLSTYGTYTNISFLQGPDAATDFLSGLWLQPGGWDAPGLAGFLDKAVHTATASGMAPGPCELIVTLWALAMVAPKAESVMGYSWFLAVYMLSGMTGNLAQLLAMSADDGRAAHLGACGAAAAVMGVLGCLAVHYTLNRDIENQAASWREEGASVRTPTLQQQKQKQLFTSSICVATICLALAGMQQLIGYPSDSGGGAGLWGEMAIGIGVVPQLIGFGTGALLGLMMGPRYALQQEVDIPLGSMTVPEDAVEMVVVMDRTTNTQRMLAASGYAVALLAAMLML